MDLGKSNAGKWISSTEAARICRVTVPTIHNWRKEKILRRVQAKQSPRRPGQRKGLPRYLFLKSDVERVAKSCIAVDC